MIKSVIKIILKLKLIAKQLFA